MQVAEGQLVVDYGQGTTEAATQSVPHDDEPTVGHKRKSAGDSERKNIEQDVKLKRRRKKKAETVDLAESLALDLYDMVEPLERQPSMWRATYCSQSLLKYRNGALTKLKKATAKIKKSDRVKTTGTIKKTDTIKTQAENVPILSSENHELAALVSYLSQSSPVERPRSRFLELPVEIRENILRHLLTKEEPIRASHCWTKAIQASTRGQANRQYLQPAVLRTCRKLNKEGIAILYGGNTFMYVVGEAGIVGPQPPTTASAAFEPEWAEQSEQEYIEEDEENEFMDFVPDDASDDEDFTDHTFHATEDAANEKLYVAKFGHLFRRIHLVAEENRSGLEYRQTMALAILKFATLAPLRANIHTVTIEITPSRNRFPSVLTFLDYFANDSPIMRALCKLPRRFIKIILNLGSDKATITFDMMYAAWIRRANRGEEDIWKGDQLMQQLRKSRAREVRQEMKMLPKRIESEFKKLEAEQRLNESMSDEDVDIW